jgi:DNA primase
MNTIDKIKNQLDIVDIISESVKLRRSGKNYTGFCPFHANTRTPAFVKQVHGAALVNAMRVGIFIDS